MKEAKPKYKRFFLKNGLEIVFVERPEKYTAAFSVWIKAGSLYETVKNSGASHFIEHLLFDGNEKYKTEEEIRLTREKLGAYINAHTTYDHLNLWGDFPPQELDGVLKLVAPMIFESLLEKKVVAKERKVVLEEIFLRKDNWETQVWLETQKTRFKKDDHPLALPIEGLETSVSQLKQSQLSSFYKKHFQPQNVLLLIGGNFSPWKVQKVTERWFAGFKNREVVNVPRFSSDDLSSFSIRTRFEKTNKIYFTLNFPAPAPKDSIRHRSAIKVLSRIIRRFRLERELREEKGLVYDFNSLWTAPTFDLGLYHFYCSCEPKKIYQIIDIVLNHYLEVKTKPVKKEELSQARDFLNKTISMNFDSLDGALDWLADDFFYYGKHFPPEYYIQERNKLQREDLLEIAQEVFCFEKANFVALGPIEEDKFHSFVQKKVEKLQ